MIKNIVKKIIASCFFTILINNYAVAENIETKFIPLIFNEILDSGVFGQNEKEAFVCFGKITEQVKSSVLNNSLILNCSGETLSLSDYVEKKLSGYFLGSNLIYKNPVVRLDRGAWYIDVRNLSGIIIYYTKQ